MPDKRHRLFTRWFSRRIDLGVILSGSLFVFIWVLLPQAPIRETRVVMETGVRAQLTRVPLSSVPAYLRPDLMLVPSDYSFMPIWQIPDVMSHVPQYRYATRRDPIVSDPEGMGQLAPLLKGLLNHYSIWLLPAANSGTAASSAFPHESRLHVRLSEGLGSTRLRTDMSVWESVLSGRQSWEFVFWIAFDAEEGEPSVFIEERSGDLDRDLRLLRIVERWDVWEAAMGMGTVRLRFEPATGEEYADKED